MFSYICFGFFFLLLVVSCTSDSVSIDKPIEVKTTDGDKRCTLKLNACELKTQGPFLNAGPQGPKGERGLTGPKGDTGYEGRPGIPGAIGFPGAVGPKGDRGDPGHNGLSGLSGPPGPAGNHGLPGVKGEEGSIGLSGLPGLDGVCYQLCPERYNSAEILDSPEGAEVFGTIDRPSDVPCNIIRNEERFAGNIWVNPTDKFLVNCPEKTGLTCLITELKDKDFIEENSFHSPATQNKSFWLSNYYSNTTKMQRFDLTQFYNKITPRQIAWLQKNTTKVTQKIRYHCKNSYIMESPETALHLFSWNDVTVGPFPSDHSPMSYSIPKGYPHDCKKGAPKTEWRFSDIVVRGTTKRFPIIDFHIRDTRNEDQSFYVELLELCFG